MGNWVSGFGVLGSLLGSQTMGMNFNTQDIDKFMFQCASQPHPTPPHPTHPPTHHLIRASRFRCRSRMGGALC